MRAPVVVLIAAIGMRLVFTVPCPPARFWDTYSYVVVSQQIRDGHVPEIGVRPIGYPLFLAATSEDGTGDRRSIRVQMLLGVVSSLLVFYSLNLVIQRTWWSAALALASTTFVDLLYAEATLYSETLCAFFVMCAVLGLASARSPSPRRWRTLAAVALCLSIATLIRPVFLVALAVLAVSLLALWLWLRLEGREVFAPILVAALILGPVVIWNGLTSGMFSIALGPGTSLLNYAGFPAVYEHLPDEWADARVTYQTLGASRPDRFVGWWDAMPALIPSGYASLSDIDRDRAAMRYALPMIASAPGGYARIWIDTVWHFLTDVDVGPGFYADPERMAEGESDLSWPIRVVATRIQAFWGYVYWVFPIAGAFVLPLFVMLSGRNRPPLSFMLLWAILWGTVFVSTLIEPCPGQARYRWPLQLPFVVMSGWAAAASIEVLRERVRRSRAVWYGVR